MPMPNVAERAGGDQVDSLLPVPQQRLVGGQAIERLAGHAKGGREVLGAPNGARLAKLGHAAAHSRIRPPAPQVFGGVRLLHGRLNAVMFHVKHYSVQKQVILAKPDNSLRYGLVSLL
jgi:hypothetical protein